MIRINQVFASLRYFVARLHHPGDGNREFLRMGMGIESRSRRLSRYWAPHQQHSRDAQVRWIAGLQDPDSLAVLGAGRLFDVAFSALRDSFHPLTLVDADPLCRPAWTAASRNGLPVNTEIRDISGVVEPWRGLVRRDLSTLDRSESSWRTILQRLECLPDGSPGAAYRPATSAVLSVNLLSQIPIVWQDAAEDLLQWHFTRGFVDPRESEWLTALDRPGRWLVEEHLRSLATCRDILVICDLEYAYYWDGPRYLTWKFAPPPLAWDGVWRTVLDCKSRVEPALYGVNLEDPATWSVLLPGHRLCWTDSWLWHLSPFGAGRTREGILHRVGAFALSAT